MKHYKNMNNKIVYYVAFYDIDKYPQEERIAGTSNLTKSNYTIKSLVNAGYNVKVISPAYSSSKKGVYKGHTDKISENISLKLMSTFGSTSYVMKKLNLLFIMGQMFTYFIRHIKKDDTIILYHSLMSGIPVVLAKYFIDFNLILEFTELYQHIYTPSKLLKWVEFKIIESADKYILSTELLIPFTSHKPYCINYGVYNKEIPIEKKHTDGKIHIVYAGIINSNKGALMIAESAKYLSDKYIIHIIGYGETADIETLQLLISRLKGHTKCDICYDGLLKGKDYISYLQKCHVGVCPQDSNAPYTHTSFPSKVLSYLSNGLRVICTEISSLTESQLSSILHFYKGNEAKNIADIIKQINFKDSFDPTELLNQLNTAYIIDLKKIIDKK